MEHVKIHWMYHVVGLVHVKIDFGDIGGEGKNFIIGCEMNIPPPPDPKTRTLEQYHAWRDRTSSFIRGDVSVMLSHPPGVIISNYLWYFHEVVFKQDDDYTTTVMDDLFYAKNGVMIHALFKTRGDVFKEQTND